MHKDLLVSSYDYDLPSNLIAKYPARPKESANLLVYERKIDKITHAKFGDLCEILPPCAVVFNDTKVIKARIFGAKKSGGSVELFLHQPLNDGEFLAQIKGRIKPGDMLSFEDGLKAEVLELLEGGIRRVRFYQNNKQIDSIKLFEILDKIGHIPLPPYIKRADEKSDESEYQSVFAKNLGAVAAPTASLHFSEHMLTNLAKNHELFYLTLHVGAGTFKGVEAENINAHKMHGEYFSLPKNVADLIEGKTPILGVGTTATRVIENYARKCELSGICELFLHPFNKPIRQDFLLTNFHLPKSTLIMLVSAFIGREKTLEIYEIAKARNYRFYSYGDAMLIL